MTKDDKIEALQIISKRLVYTTAIMMLVAGGVSLGGIFQDRIMISWLVISCGIIGGFVSIQQRLKRMEDNELKLLSQSWPQILVIPLFGGVFAMVLYIMVLSGIVDGDLFPNFYIQKPEGIPDNEFLESLLWKTYPMTGEDFGKLLFWSFAAGFSERLVPSLINSKVNTTEENPP
ncbi:hypothetical protein LNTAR_09119 [Lentisphaera araneosa HTCC2155]|uniref:Uncharacterized protein n=1 Tax=Lentisphaera araneosa HTCC2155 TaxID=313628 RepID=A6DI65_9BACT|nr:hypothetical protein [Lentisphaera araneosa]EDM28719.1 hypothetical protein LNTAR_09119 [Lentisphaera araneosa HTCC2155]